MHEVFANDLSPAIRPAALKLLLELHRHDALEAAPEAIRSVARYYGVRVDAD